MASAKMLSVIYSIKIFPHHSLLASGVLSLLVAKSCLTCAIPWAVARHATLSMEFPRQQFRGSSFPPPGDLPDPGITPTSPALAGGFFTAEPPGKLNADLDAVK